MHNIGAGPKITNMNLKAYNPIQLRGTAIPPHLLLMVKIITIGLAGKGYLQNFPKPFLPFLPVFDSLPGFTFQITLKILFVVFGVLLLINQKTRLSCLILGCIFLMATLSSKVYFSNGKVFCAAIYIMTALSGQKKRPWLIQLQIIIVYFGSGLNKLLDVDWQTGQYIDHWLVNVRNSQFYYYLTQIVSPELASGFFSWSTILLELIILPITLIVRKWQGLGIWLGIVFHSLIFWLSGLSFGIFFPGILASYLAFANLPRKVALFGAQRPLLSKSLMNAFKLFNPDNWYVFSENHNQSIKNGLVINFNQKDNWISYFGRLRLMLIYHPLFYFVVMLLFTLPYLPNMAQHLAALLAIVLFFPYYTRIHAIFK